MSSTNRCFEYRAEGATLCHKEPANEMPIERGFWCLKLCLYGIRELAKKHYDLNQWEHSVWRDLDQWEHHPSDLAGVGAAVKLGGLGDGQAVVVGLDEPGLGVEVNPPAILQPVDVEVQVGVGNGVAPEGKINCFINYTWKYVSSFWATLEKNIHLLESWNTK